LEALVEKRLTGYNEAKDEGRSSAPRSSEPPAGTDRREIEWQYEAPDGLERVEEWLLERNGLEPFGFSVLEGSSAELVDAYYDTVDWQLYRAGYALRVRQEVGGSYEATMKTLTPAGSVAGNLRGWREISEPLKSDEADVLLEATGLVGRRFKEFVCQRRLRSLFVVRTCRRTFGLVSAGVRVGEVALDRSEIALDGDEPTRLVRVEIEADPSATTIPQELEGFVEAMQEALGLQSTAISKYEAGLSAIGQSPKSNPGAGAKGAKEK
jgi:inorganic triphosphatase YgiF